MTPIRASLFLAKSSIIGSEKGFVLAIALVLLATLTLVGSTAFVLTSTDIKVGGNYKFSQQALYVASAGTEHGREILRVLNAASSNQNSFNDELAGRTGGNSVLDGYATGSDDVPLVNSTSLGNYSYIVYLTNDGVDGATNQVDSNNRVLITSIATGPGGAFARVETEVVRYGGSIPINGAVYGEGDFTGNGSSVTIDGNDRCGAAAAVPPIYTLDPATTTLNGDPTLDGDPPTAQQGTQDIDIGALVNSLKAGATVITTDQSGTDFGDSSTYVTVYSDTSNPVNANGLKIQNGTGYGMLLVDGDLTLGGGFSWYGPILVTGTLTFNGGGGGINIKGSVMAGQTVDLNGGIDIRYDSCEVASSLPPASVGTASWKQAY